MALVLYKPTDVLELGPYLGFLGECLKGKKQDDIRKQTEEKDSGGPNA